MFSPRLLIINKNQLVLDLLNCKIIVNKITKKLCVIPKKAGSKKVVISFKRKFVYTKNILCCLTSSKDSNSYVLILKSERICKQIFEIVEKTKESIDAHERHRYRKHIKKLLRNANVKTKIVENGYKVSVDKKNILRQDDNRNNISCRNSENESSNEVSPKRPKTDYVMMKKIYESPYFEKVVAERKEKLKKRLLIFPNNNDKIYHFEYYWNRPLQCYQCCGCGLKADIIKNDKNDGKEFVKHKFLHKQMSKHFCKLRKYDETKYTVDVSTRIVENENFKIIKYTQKGISTSKLFIFDSTNKNLCRGYLWDSTNEYYLCIGCSIKNPRVFARLCKNVDGIEYLILCKNQHVCDLKEFNPDKYKNDVIIKKPMYKHVECFWNGEKRKYLLVFTDENQKFYYKFTYENGYLPICLKCNQKHLYIQAYILTDKNGDEYISVRDKKHVCTPFEYNETDFEKNQIIQPERYKIIKRNWRGKFVEKLVIFDSINKNLCHEYTLQRGKSTKRYKCNECHHKHSTCVIAWIINYEKENEHVELGKTPHKCSLIKFEDPNSSIINLPNFKIIKTAAKFKKSGNPKDSLFIYSSLEKKLCYRYYFDTTSKAFVCHECDYKHRKRVTAKIHKNENDDDFVQLNENKHICKPQPEKDIMSRFFNIHN